MSVVEVPTSGGLWYQGISAVSGFRTRVFSTLEDAREEETWLNGRWSEHEKLLWAQYERHKGKMVERGLATVEDMDNEVLDDNQVDYDVRRYLRSLMVSCQRGMLPTVMRDPVDQPTDDLIVWKSCCRLETFTHLVTDGLHEQAEVLWLGRARTSEILDILNDLRARGTDPSLP